MQRFCFRTGVLFAGLFLLATCALAQNEPADPQVEQNLRPARSMILQQTQYQLRAGERISISAPQETIDFVRGAKARTVTINGAKGKGIAFGPTPRGDGMVLATSLTAQPGEYVVNLSATNEAGETRRATVEITVEKLQAATSSTPLPVVLLNGFQVSATSSCPIGKNPFGTLMNQLSNAGVPVYFFDNCVEQQVNGDSIEELGETLGQFLQSAPQVDLVGHSMGGLIVRAYLAGMQTNTSGNFVFSPPPNPRVRKFIEVATPNFGSFLAALDLSGKQGQEMVPGSAFLWNLARWNQGSDDLRGVDALAIVGNGGYHPQSGENDGVVSLTSASLGSFSRAPSRTRILPYCHTDPASTLFAIDCLDQSITDAPETIAIVSSFLADTTAWTSIGTTPTQDPWLSQYGGIYFALENAPGTQYLSPTTVSWGSIALQPGGSGSFFYQEFVKGTGTLQVTSASIGTVACGSFTATAGFYKTIRCKYPPGIVSVGPVLVNTSALTVQSGGTVTINGSGFGQYCSTCGVWAYPGTIALTVLSWNDQAITVSLPATFSGFVQLLVQNGAGSDVIGVEVTPPIKALTQVAAGGTLSTGIFVFNTGTAPASFSVQFYGDDGNPLILPFTGGSTSRLSGTLPAQGSAYYEAGNPQIQTLQGWAQINSDSSIVAQALFRNDVNGTFYEAAVPSTKPGKEFVIPFDSTIFATTSEPFVTGVAIANLDSATANVTCTAYSANGGVIPGAVLVPALAPLGHWASYQFPALNGQRGTIDCVSNTNISGLALRFLGSELTSLPVVTNPTSLLGSAKSGAIAQVAAGGTLTTGIFVLNTGNSAANFSLGFYGDQGNPLALPFTGGAASTLSGTMPAHGSAYYEAGNPQLALVQGWGLFTADPSIAIQALFRNSVNGTYYEAAVPSTPGGSSEVLFPFDATTFAAAGQPLVTGVAIANLNTTSANVTCVARDPNGIVIPNSVTIPTLPPLGHWAGFQFPVLMGQRGTIDCNSNTNISATALRALGSALSSLPVVTK